MALSGNHSSNLKAKAKSFFVSALNSFFVEFFPEDGKYYFFFYLFQPLRERQRGCSQIVPHINTSLGLSLQKENEQKPYFFFIRMQPEDLRMLMYDHGLLKQIAYSI
tara:strand:- start:1417 stop:1737 length:321 start_codon:yes stop_codon:yes gene_type:complete